MTYPQNRMYMVDPVTGAVASAVANHSVAKIKEYIESSDDPETVWEESVYELAVKLRTAHKQDELLLKQDRFGRELERSGIMARELAIRGEVRDFNEASIELVKSVADAIAEVRDIGDVGGNSLEAIYKDEGLDDYVEECIERFGPGSS